MIEDLLVLVKFGKRQYIEKLLKEGSVFFNKPEEYVDSKIQGQSDKLEGAEWIVNNGFEKISYNHPKIGSGSFKLKDDKGQLIQYNNNFLSNSLYGITKDDFIKHNLIFSIGERMKNFGDTALMIKKPYRFLNTIAKELKNINIQFEINKVDYKNLSKDGEIKINPFLKDKQFEYQNEYRIIIERLNNNTNEILIGSLEDYSLISDSKSMIETVWNVNMK